LVPAIRVSGFASPSFTITVSDFPQFFFGGGLFVFLLVCFSLWGGGLVFFGVFLWVFWLVFLVGCFLWCGGLFGCFF